MNEPDGPGRPTGRGNVTRGTRGINRTIGVAERAGEITRAAIERFAAACTQDDPPACTAACPLHVDARGLLARAADGDWTAALDVLRRTVLFPAVLARTCPQPCRLPCRRGEAGDPIAIAAVERACTEFGRTSGGPGAAPPRRRQRIAVVGGGLAGAAAALDLARRGYPVTLFEASGRLGGRVRDLPGDVLPSRVIDTELAAVAAAGVQVRLDEEVDPAALKQLRTGFDAVILATGAGSPVPGPAPGATPGGGPGPGRDADGVPVEDVTGATGQPGVFAAGSVAAGTPAGDPLAALVSARRAAVSADRYVQGVSVTASREVPGPQVSCLFTDIGGVAEAPAVAPADPVAGYPEDRARAEAARCLQCSCLECVNACSYLEHYGSYPKLYARKVLHNLYMVKGAHTANRMINSCSLCGLCGQVCPTGVDMGAMLKQVRRRMVRQEQMPPSAHDFALRDLAFSNGPDAALARPAPHTTGSPYAFFPGCQLPASDPGSVDRTYRYLRETLGAVGLILRCCGAPADWAGRQDLVASTWQDFDTAWAALGHPTLVLACTSCAAQFAEHRPDVPVTSLWSVLDEYGPPPGTPPAPPGQVLTIHDPCTARQDTAVQDAVRRVLDTLGYRVAELPHSRRRTECCSYGGLQWLANREVAELAVQRRIAQSPHDYLTYCVMCRDLFADRGKPSLHLLDLLGGDDLAARAARPGPGYTQRHENRARLKRDLLRDLWGEQMDDPGDGPAIRLRVDAQVRERLEDRLILDADLAQVIAQAESTGAVLRDPRTGHLLAHHRPHAVTYWVEYTRDGDVYAVHRAYSHRMQVIEGDPGGR